MRRLSSTYTRRRGFCCAKYFALSSISASVIAFAILSMFWLGRYASGPVGLRLPLRKSSSCSLMYASGNPASAEFSGRPWPVGVWQ